MHRRPREHRIETVATHDRAKHVAVARQIDAPDRRSRLTPHDLHRGSIERNPKLLEREHSLGNQTAGANLESRVRRFMTRHTPPRKLRRPPQKVERVSQSCRTSPSNQHLTFLQASHKKK